MRALIQRVSRAEVRVADKICGEISTKNGTGLLVLAGFCGEDNEQDIDWMCRKLCRLRLFNDDNGVMNRNIQEVGGQILAVSQFTLYADCQKGCRPSWGQAAPRHLAEPLYLRFVEQLQKTLGKIVPSGIFAADMEVSLINHGPVTVLLDSRPN